MENMCIEGLDNMEIKTMGDVVIAYSEDGLCGLFTKSGKALTPFCIEEILFVASMDYEDEEVFYYQDCTNFVFDIIVVRIGKYWGAFNISGKEIAPCIYEEIDLNGVMLNVKKDGFWGVLDKEGNEISMCIYDNIGLYQCGYARVKKDGYWGFIDKKGRKVIRCVYDDAHDYFDGSAEVKKNGLWGFIDKKGKVIIDCVYEAEDFDYNCFAKIVRGHNMSYWIFDKDGEIQIACR